MKNRFGLYRKQKRPIRVLSMAAVTFTFVSGKEEKTPAFCGNQTAIQKQKRKLGFVGQAPTDTARCV